jgi:DNA-binding XRE family transcriptional regulator
VTWRVVYRIDADAIVIADVFSKKSPQTPKSEIQLCRTRLKGTTVRQAKRKRLESKGWTVGSVQDFLGLSDEEAQYVELRLRLAEGLKKTRNARGLTQTEVAKTVGSSQSRVAKMESGDATVSVDLLVRSLLRMGASTRDIGRMLSGRSRAA